MRNLPVDLLQVILFDSTVMNQLFVSMHAPFGENPKKVNLVFRVVQASVILGLSSRFFQFWTTTVNFWNFWTDLPELLEFYYHFQVVTEAHFQIDGETLRVVTAHVPGAPFGPARSEFVECLASLKGTVPTVLMADLNFPEKAKG